MVDYCTRFIVTSKPSNTAVYYVQRGREYCLLGQYENAINDFDKYLSIDKSESVLDKISETMLRPVLYQWRAFAYHSLGQYQKAIDDYDKRISLRPKDAETYQRRGNAFAWLREYSRAVDDCTSAININPKLIAAYVTRATAYRGLHRNDLATSDEKLAEKLGYKRPQRD